MTISKRGDDWVVRVELGQGANGKRHQEYKRFKTRREAVAHEAELLSLKAAGKSTGWSKQPYGEFVRTRFLPSVAAKGARETTVHNYDRYMRLHILPTLGHVPLKDITTLMLDDLYQQLAKKPRRYHDGLISPHTVLHVHVLINMSLKAAVRWRMLPENVAELAHPPRKASFYKPVKAWNEDEALAYLLWLQAIGDRLYALWFLLLSTGMRRGEALGLMWNDIDWVEGTISIERSLTTTPHISSVPELTATKSPKGVRRLKIGEDLMAVLRAHQKRQKYESWAAGPDWVDSGLVFCTRVGEPLRPPTISERFREQLQRAIKSGVPVSRITLHGLRHTFVTLNIKAGIHARIISERVGHHSAAYTVDTYGYVDVAAQQDAADAIQSMLRGQSPKQVREGRQPDGPGARPNVSRS